MMIPMDIFVPLSTGGANPAALTKNGLRGPPTGHRDATGRLFPDFLEAYPDAVVLVDETGEILHSNALMLEVFGYRPEELLGRPIDVLIPERLRDRHAGHLDRYFAAAHTRRMGQGLELSGVRKDGNEFPIDVALSPFHADGKLLVAAAIRDMSLHRKLESDLRQRTHDLEEANRLKDQFLATLAHELRNPLAALNLAGQRLRLPGAHDRIAWVADAIDRETTHMLRMVEDLLDVARLQQGKVTLRMETVDLAAVAGQAVETTRPSIDSRGHAFDFARPAGPVWVQGDETRLCQVIVNLLDNAARYTPTGGHIWLEVDKDEREAIVRVRDTGVGISPELLPRVFELFAQADHPGLDVGGGLGIGLALVRKLVAMHGGTVSVASDGPDRGAVFTVRIPLVAQPHH